MLTDAKARRIRPGDKAMADGGVPGLYLSPSLKPGRGKWTFRFVSPETRKRRDMGVGAYPDISIVSARDTARRARESIALGIDPIEERRRAATIKAHRASIPTFREAACDVHADIAPGFRNRKHAAQWIKTLDSYAFPRIGETPVDQLTARDFADVLKPIWLSKPETASRLRQRMHRVMNWCAANGHVSASPLPAINDLLPRQPGKAQRVVHYPAVPWRECPAVVMQLFEKAPLRVGKQALLFLILTAARSGEVRGLTWSEIDWSESLWIVPAERMKTRQPHRVPLSPPAMAILKNLATVSDRTGIVFEPRSGRQLSDMTLTKILRDANIPSDTPGRTATVHGFRSTFRDWASESGYPRDVAERALAHTVRNQVEAAYHRTDLLDQRRDMMDRWAEFVVKDLD